ncbi:transcriptional regulator, Crp/Fnr family [Nitrobacter hamburgensis X14]|uniref:Transcriptional regulator, Crp/Fnr family n=1 Tax=Nitrobacter hamburgensis (strain DSM 10229 / NCIMB 13809 / X14) TaxID=323097 RepID=Q1QLZ3_NITHX|nr:cyclic nucleotide-binding domain-containing protein [Nitrobacter hamburgensis]ABE62754.1 transcriptional regulator, Crp/Fnr family [Nitrobacter hamburgensis X14]
MHTQTITAPTVNALDIPHVMAAEPADQFSAIVRCSRVVASEFSYNKDEEIYGEGEPSEYLYQIISGAVRTYKLLSDGRRQISAFHLPGDVFGLDPGSEHRLTAEAITNTTVRLVPRRNLEKAAASNVQVTRNLWTITASDLRHAEDHMLLLGRKTAMERVATFLLEMDRRLARAGMMALPMCRRDIGDYLGLTLETVSRALSQLNDEGILMFSSARQIALRNRQRLSTMEA